jgi:serine/threonine protein phosphatase 1
MHNAPKFLKITPPKNGRRWAIGDIHGCFYTLKVLLEDRLSICQNDHIYFLGDYIDKGPHSHLVLDYLMDLQVNGYQLFTLRGNHEENLLYAQQNYNDRMLRLFVAKMNKSPQLMADDGRVKSVYIDFCEKMPYYIELQDYFLVHAGFRFHLAEPFADWIGMLEVGKTDSAAIYLENKTLLVGHHPTNISEIEKMILQKQKIICLDNGCVYNKPHKRLDFNQLGHLCAFNLDTWELIRQKNLDI